MTEAEWLACDEPRPMLDFLRYKASERKLRLFACACCRRIGHLLTDPLAQGALDTAEHFADGLAGDGERSAARKAAQQAAQSRAVIRQPTAPKWARRAASAVYYAAASDAWAASSHARDMATVALLWRAGGYDTPAREGVESAESLAQAALLRDIFGDPFRPLPRLNPAWLAWEGGTVPKLAAAAYEKRAFDRLPILADALEEAGCDLAELLTHLRGPGPHVRGCWAVDLILGKG